MNYASKHIDRADEEISFGKMVKRYFQARDDFIASSDVTDDTELNELDLCEAKVKNKLFEMWREGRISIRFE
jgi:hypothetical protein